MFAESGSHGVERRAAVLDARQRAQDAKEREGTEEPAYQLRADVCRGVTEPDPAGDRVANGNRRVEPKASIAAVTASPAASAAGSGLDCGMENSGTPSPATTMKRLPKASADSLDTSPCRISAPLPAVSPEAGSRWTGTGVVMVGQSLSLGFGAFAFCQGILGVG
jgi:hypothetical protein